MIHIVYVSKNIDSSPISILEDIFNVKQLSKNKKQRYFLLTEIHEQKVIMDFQWIDDLKVLISSFSIDNYEYSFLTNHMNKINNNLVIGTLNKIIIIKLFIDIVSNFRKSNYRRY